MSQSPEHVTVIAPSRMLAELWCSRNGINSRRSTIVWEASELSRCLMGITAAERVVVVDRFPIDGPWGREKARDAMERLHTKRIPIEHADV